ncbi:TapY2 family type IVa secretion system protein [Shewanella benthica]|nr:TapY2 family type IVa secretion system protein [Shewanella benthica]
MNRQLLCLAAMSMAISGFALAAQDSNSNQKDYKCYLDTTSGYQIAFYEWQEKQIQLRMAMLPANKVPNIGTGESAYIKDVEECVEIDESFTLGAAQKLDEITLK